MSKARRVWVTNLGKKDIEATIDLIDHDGTVFASNPVLTYLPGRPNGLEASGTTSSVGWCRVTGKFSKKKVLVSLTLREAGITRMSVMGR